MGFHAYANGTTYSNRTDQLGTPRLSTDYTGAVAREEGALMGPWGDNFTETGSFIDFTGFAGGFWDSENNGEQFGAREYENTHGSWLSPDPAGMAAVDISNPQSWNRYAYVLDNPVSFIDPTGLACWPFERVMFGNCGAFMNNGVYFGAGWSGLDLMNFYYRYEGSDEHIYWFLSLGLASLFGGSSAAANNGPIAPLVMKNPCSVQGRALPPGAYETQGQQANAGTTNFLLDVSMGWPKGDYLDPQPLASGNVFQNQAYGNYVFGVYMAAAGSSLNTALSGASALALGSGAYFTYTKNGYQMDPNYPLLPAANVGNITNGYNAYGNGTVCHK